MSDIEVQTAAAPTPQAPGLSQIERVIDTFTAPSKTFEDIKRGNKSWWMPFIILTAVAWLFAATVGAKVGWQQVVENNNHMNPKAEERMQQMPADQKEMANKITIGITEGLTFGFPLLVLGFSAIGSLLLWGTINFVFGGKAKFGSIFAVSIYTGLPGIIKYLLAIVVIFVGSAAESFNLNNPAPTNVAAFLSVLDTNRALYTFATFLDFTVIWGLVLQGIGLSIVAGVKRSSGYIAVFAWWAIMVILFTGIAAIFS
jgi:hypothetical protein